MHVSHTSRLPVSSSVILGALSSISLGWLSYYAVQDTIRRATIRSRRKKFPLNIRSVGPLTQYAEKQTRTSSGEVKTNSKLEEAQSSVADWYGRAHGKELQSIKRRFAPLRILGRYVNPFPEWRETGVWELLYWKLIHSMLQKPRRMAWDGALAADLATESGKKKVEELLPVYPLDKERLWGSSKGQPCAESDKMTYTWIGQSTCLIQMNGLNILTDPVFGLQPIESIFSPTRMRPMPCTIQDLTDGKIDVVLISHE